MENPYIEVSVLPQVGGKIWGAVEKSTSKELLNKAFGLSPLLVFPFREESIPVFKWASEALTDDWKTRYYLALIFWDKDRIEEAKELFDACSEPDYATFYLVRAHFYFEQALKLDEGNWRSWHHLIDFCIDRKLKSKDISRKIKNRKAI